MLNYTLLRPAWFTTANEVDHEITRKGGPERGSVVSQKSLAPFIMKNHLLTYSACGCWPATGSSTT
jgi:hypothetical protein